MKVDELAAVWPDNYPRPAAATNENHRYMVHGFGQDFAGREADSISREEARHWCLANLGAARYVRSMFNDAAADGLIDHRHPFIGLQLPQPGDTVIDYPSEFELSKLINAAIDSERPWLAATMEFAATTGLRLGEQCAVLRPGDGGMGNFLMHRADHDSGLMERGEVKWQRLKSGSLKRPKTPKSLREFAIFPLGRLAVERARLEARDQRSAFLFPSRNALEHQWRDLRIQTGLHFRWHSFRHYHATWLLDRGAKVDDVAVQLGCSVKTVEDHYGHPDAGLALGRLEQLQGAVDAMQSHTGR